MARDLRNTNYGKECLALGYVLTGSAKDSRGKVRKYRTSPASGSGGINYYDTLADLRKWLVDVRDIRLMQEDPAAWERRRQQRDYHGFVVEQHTNNRR